jgi:predicted GNAT superfamily acetyltransferase
MTKKSKTDWLLRILEKPAEMLAAEELQRVVWPGSETDVIPLFLLVTAAHHGGIVIGAYPKPGDSASDQSETRPDSDPLAGFVFGFPGLYFTPDGPRPMHCSQQLAVHPQYRNQGLAFHLKRAQWQMVRHQGLDLITWTFDPLLSHNAYLNIARLGAVCNLYIRDAYGDMKDELNIGLASDRFEAAWWVNSQRVKSRLSSLARRQLELPHFLAAGAEIINPSVAGEDHWPHPTKAQLPDDSTRSPSDIPLLLVEIPADFQALRADDLSLALEWRISTRHIFEELFDRGYLVTDFVHQRGNLPRSYYVLSHGESTL